jgi:hypothetical protein
MKSVLRLSLTLFLSGVLLIESDRLFTQWHLKSLQTQENQTLLALESPQTLDLTIEDQKHQRQIPIIDDSLVELVTSGNVSSDLRN